jgi:hypothetical protein
VQIVGCATPVAVASRIATGRRLLTIVTVASAMFALSVGGARAATATVLLTKSDVTLTDAADGSWTAAVGLSNLTNASMPVTATTTSTKCALTIGGGSSIELAPATQTTVSVGIPKACDAEAKSDGFVFTINTADATSGPPLKVTATKDDDPPVHWSRLLAFLGAIGVALIVVISLFLFWLPDTNPPSASEPPEAVAEDPKPHGEQTNATPGPKLKARIRAWLRAPLAVGPKEVVQAGDGCLAPECLVSSAMVVFPQPAVKGSGALV